MTDEIRVVIADDHPIYREGVARTLDDSPGIVVVGQAQNGEEAVDLTRKLRPDLVLLDISMPKGGGIGALTAIQKLDDPPHVAILTGSEDHEDLATAMKMGALGYVLKGIGAGELTALVRTLAEGQPYVSPGIAGRFLGRAAPDAPKPNPFADLTKREETILRLVAKGYSNREVGEALELQEKTVKHYMTSILQKLNLRNRVEAAVQAREFFGG
jgi:two-component system nitrate/nitrite response regulator NarL